MKRLIVTYKPAAAVLKDFEKALGRTKRKVKNPTPHFEISFDDKKLFDRFVKHMPLLAVIANSRPQSVYELAQSLQVDVSNLNKTIQFLEAIGALRVVTTVSSGRTVRTPIVEYDRVEFALAA